MRIPLSRAIALSELKVKDNNGKKVTITQLHPDKQECKVNGKWIPLKQLHIDI